EPHLPAPPTHSTPAPTSLLFLLTLRPPPQPPLFPYTTLFRSDEHAPPGRAPGDGSRNRPRPGGGPAPRGRRRVAPVGSRCDRPRSEEHTSELQSLTNLVCRLLLEKKKSTKHISTRPRNRQSAS